MTKSTITVRFTTDALFPDGPAGCDVALSADEFRTQLLAKLRRAGYHEAEWNIDIQHSDVDQVLANDLGKHAILPDETDWICIMIEELRDDPDRWAVIDALIAL